MLRLTWIGFAAACSIAVGCSSSEGSGETREPEAYATCRYENPFSEAEECRGYFGDGWTVSAIEEDCSRPFTGVVGDFSGHPTKKLKSLKDRKFVNIDRDNINDVMKQMNPGLNMRVENTLKGDGSEMAVQLEFNSMDDFDPANVANQVEPLKKLLETRDKLRDLLTKVDLSDELETVLEDVLKNTENVQKLAGELGLGAGSSSEESAAETPADDAEPEGDA